MLENESLNVMVIGGGGREHAICWKVSQSPFLKRLYCAPGNGGTSQLPKTENISLKVGDFSGIANFAKEKMIDLVVIGPDNPLADGIVDYLENEGLRVFGPRQAAARLESSKAFAKEFMVKHNIPTAKHHIVNSHEEAVDYIRANDWARVVKVDGLALGKGVFVCDNETETRDALQIIFRENRFGDSGRTVVLEERLLGEELSLLMFCDGKTLSLMPASQDHKRRFEQDRGPNTGGMGVFVPVELWERAKDSIIKEVVEPLEQAIKSGEFSYKGVLYAGLLIVESRQADNHEAHRHPSPWAGRTYKPYVLEFNARFGDPETQVILPLLESDLLEIFLACCNGTLSTQEIKWSERAACCVIACADSYPEGASQGEEITIGDCRNGTIIFHSGTKMDGTRLLSAGGRVLGITALGDDLNAAVDHAYEGIKSVSFKGMDYRKDIGRRALSRCP